MINVMKTIKSDLFDSDCSACEEAIDEFGVDATDLKGDLTLLHAACYFAADHIVRFLIEKGADVNKKANRGMTPSHFLAHGRIYGSPFLNDEEQDCRRQSILTFMIASGAEIDTRDANGNTPLIFALGQQIGHGCWPLLAYSLVSEGADVHTTDADGNTTIHLSAAYIPTARRLLTHLINLEVALDAQNKKGQTALEMLDASDFLKEPARSILVAAGAK